MEDKARGGGRWSKGLTEDEEEKVEEEGEGRREESLDREGEGGRGG